MLNSICVKSKTCLENLFLVLLKIYFEKFFLLSARKARYKRRDRIGMENYLPFVVVMPSPACNLFM